MRHIVVDATPIQPGPSGSRTRIEALLPRLAACLPDDQFEVHWAADGGGPSGGVEAENVVHATVDLSCRGGAQRWLRVGRHLRRRHREIAFSHLLVDHGPLGLADRVRVLVQLHDLRFLYGYGGWWRASYARTLWARRLRRVAAIVGVSSSVAREATAAFGLADARVHVAPNAPGDAFVPPAPGLRREGAALVSRDEPRKAVGAAVAAAEAAGLTLDLVQGERDSVGVAARVQAARWVLAPSLYEGFDLPVVEALACGTPVVASSIPAHEDHVALGARGLRLVPPPRFEGGAWLWPEAIEALRGEPPEVVRPPTPTWDDAARVVADAMLEA